MCGIAGLLSLSPESPLEQAVVESMADCLRHRGPDDRGVYVDKHVALGHRRLSIIDLAGGHQPLANEDGSLRLIFNGEIYNFASLRKELEDKGHRFSTCTDSEVILHAYEEEGVRCLERLNGMFAFALWDARKRLLFCARDRMGQKPLYYGIVGGQFVFASELKAFRRHPRMTPRLDLKALTAYLAYEYVPSPMSILEGIRKLEAGCFLVVEVDQPPRIIDEIQPQRYWDIRFDPHERPSEIMASELVEHLRRAVERRLVADVPLGVFLSGGIDSSAIVALMTQLRPANTVQTFTIGFDDPTYDESSHARLVARHFGTDHHEERLSAGRMLEILPQVLEQMDEPFADPSILPTSLLSGFARKHVTVALGGDGGDELFAGYDPFAAHLAGGIASAIPMWIRRGMNRAAGCLPTSHRNISLDFKVRKFLEGLNYPPSERHWAWMGSFPPDRQRQILRPEALENVVPEEAYALAQKYWDSAAGSDDVHRTIYQYCKLYLQDDILVKIDRASMMHGLEARSPMMDYEFVEWTAGVPSNQKLSGLRRKILLKKAMRGLLPDAVIDRPKKGFGIPVGRWLQGPLRENLERTLSVDAIEATGLFRPDPIQRLILEHMENRLDHRKPLWTLLVFMEWWKRWMQS